MGSCNPPGSVVSGELIILLVGPRRTGKSSTGNTLLGRGQAFGTRGGVASTAASGINAGLHLSVVDAQGWGSSEESVPEEEKTELLRAVSLCGRGGPHVVLLVIPLLDFTEPERRAVERRMEILTSTVWRHTMVLFTCGDRLRGNVEEHIRSGGPALHWLMEKCRDRYHVFNNKEAAIVKQERRTQEVKRGVKRHEGTWWKKTVKEAGMRSKGSAADRRQEGEHEQVRELLSKVENVLQENGGWHFSLHMYRRLEEQWSCREQELRARLEADGRKQETNMEPAQEQRLEKEEQGNYLRKEGGNREGCVERKMNRGKYKEERAKEELKRLSSKEDGSDSGGEREESTDVKTRMMAPSRPHGGQRLAFSPIRGLA